MATSLGASGGQYSSHISTGEQKYNFIILHVVMVYLTKIKRYIPLHENI